MLAGPETLLLSLFLLNFNFFANLFALTFSPPLTNFEMNATPNLIFVFVFSPLFSRYVHH